MDLATRKKRFIEEFKKISEADKITLFEELLERASVKNPIVAHSALGRPITLTAYRQRNLKALVSCQVDHVC